MHQHMVQHHQGQNGTFHQPQLPPEVPARTPVCIGQLVVTALVLYPIPYLNHHSSGMSTDPNMPSESDDFAPVRLRYDPLAKERSATGDETIHILTPQTKYGDGADEKLFGGDNFGVVEQRVATVLGPMLGKGLIRVDAKIRRGIPNVSIDSSRVFEHDTIYFSVAYPPVTSSLVHPQGQHSDCVYLFAEFFPDA